MRTYVGSDVVEEADRVVKLLVGQINTLRLNRMDIRYSFHTEDFDSVKQRFESNGFMVRMDSKFNSYYIITVIYYRHEKSC